MVAAMAIRAWEFRTAALREVGRYGDDPWVFLRELLQNARDAGATRVVVTTRRMDSRDEITIADDGDGMSRDDAQRFLFTLYASSKAEDTKMAGVFGVGFWSVLAFEPDVIELVSRTAGSSEGWRLSLNASLECIDEGSCRVPVGTKVRLVRKAGKGDLDQEVWSAVRRDARHLRQSRRPDAMLDVLVNGRRATQRMVPGEPGISFRGPGMRGVVSLGESPELVLLAHGLRVRTLSTVEDLLVGPGRRRSGRRTTRNGLWPRVVVDSDRLAVLMARGDVAQDRELVRVARRVESETRKLYTNELDRLAPLSFFRKLLTLVAEYRTGLGWGCVIGLLLIGGVALTKVMHADGEVRPNSVGSAGGSAAGYSETIVSGPYRDRFSAYEGPALDTVGGRLEMPDFTYSPDHLTPAFAAFRMIGVDEVGMPVDVEGDLLPVGPVEPDGESSVFVNAVFSSSAPIMRVPVPTGYLIDPDSVRVNGDRAQTWRTADGMPVIETGDLEEADLSYRTVPGKEPAARVGRWPALPHPVLAQVDAMSRLPPVRRISRAVDLVRGLVTTRLDSGTYGLLRRARLRGDPLIASALKVGGGDCDVVNVVLASVLDAAGLQARMAVGWIGSDGNPLPGYHAWVEVDVGKGEWVVADASTAVPGRGARTTTAGSAVADREVTPGEERRLLAGPVIVALLVLAVAVVAASGVVFRRQRFHRRMVAGSDPDPGRMVESILGDPRGSADFRNARWRPLVPLLGGRRCSIASLERAASGKRLYAASSGGEVADQALRAGCVVVDASLRAGRAAASALRAVDIDRWNRLASGARSSDLGRRVAGSLGDSDLVFEILEVRGLTSAAEGLHVPGLSPVRILVNQDDSRWKKAADLLIERPREAIFRGGDLLTGALQGLGGITTRKVSGLAREAVFEVSGRER